MLIHQFNIGDNKLEGRGQTSAACFPVSFETVVTFLLRSNDPGGKLEEGGDWVHDKERAVKLL